jgi:DNA repair protein RecN (Recombination protein N)
MLSQLIVQNYALIENVNIQWNPGFTAITGETGSGKSILLGALGLVLGERADLSLAGEPGKKCVVEATFKTQISEVIDLLRDNDLDVEEDLILRREIVPGGRSRAFVNDSPVTLELLGAFGRALVDVHSQHEHLAIGSRNFLLPLLDGVSGNASLCRDFNIEFKEWKLELARLAELEDREARSKMDEDYLRFQLAELDALNLDKLDITGIEQELETLTNAEEIRKQLGLAHSALEREENGALDIIQQALGQLNKVTRYNDKLPLISERLEASRREIADIAEDIERFMQHLVFDTSRIQELTELSGTLFTLKQKHRLQEYTDLIAVRDEMRDKLEGLGSLESDIAALRARCTATKSRLEKIATQLSDSRKKAALTLAAEIREILAELRMVQAEIRFELSAEPELNEYGKDGVILAFRPTSSSPFKPIRKIASGGELSRVMIALKAAISAHRELPTLILDEVDTGVSGEVASRVGKLMKNMASRSQVIAITHLPQIAGQADTHYKVSKETLGDKSYTQVTSLSKEERIQEIASLISGTKTTPAALKQARELLEL